MIKEYDLNGYRIARCSIPQTRLTSKDVWFVDEFVEVTSGSKGTKNIAQFDTEDEARAYTAFMWATTN